MAEQIPEKTTKQKIAGLSGAARNDYVENQFQIILGDFSAEAKLAAQNNIVIVMSYYRVQENDTAIKNLGLRVLKALEEPAGDVYLHTIKAFLAERQAEKALDICNQAIATHPNNQHFPVEKIRTFLRLGKGKDAQKYNAQAHQRFPENTDIAAMYATGLALRGEIDETFKVIAPFLQKIHKHGRKKGHLFANAHTFIALQMALLGDEEQSELQSLFDDAADEGINVNSRARKYRTRMENFGNLPKAQRPMAFANEMIGSFKDNDLWDRLAKSRPVDRTAWRVSKKPHANESPTRPFTPDD